VSGGPPKYGRFLAHDAVKVAAKGSELSDQVERALRPKGSTHRGRIAILFDSDQSLKTLGPSSKAAPLGEVGVRRQDAASGLHGRLEVRLGGESPVQ
jgi:hypothetical protein